MRNLAKFTGSNYDKGRGVIWQITWLFISGAVFMRWWCPNSARSAILRLFGAQIGGGVVIKPQVKIHWPWKLEVGDNSWIGEKAWILNLESVSIGHDTCISQDVLICTGSHDYKSETFEFDNAPIKIGDRTWIAARSTVLRGVTIGNDALVGCNSLVTRDVPNSYRVRPHPSIRESVITE
ncbi:WcaF family extracellular polysaccharide biosynthesis acetyltransferase [Rhodococcus sp. PML026]|uniref:WcaF family extracellular polysaccharide biosynthesis acetyltransferase n=1 Tax=Rhodococcus sp. PML026 TaxID=1356405 RepID=UPI00061F7950|nr:WcaF family extracellular polysaccharide biosynthesis acetyltransferase [Rhodococcus sp. PML026]KJV03317.1 maltose O-acetyltransferase [Rhodococcus sp. PML026]